MAKPRKIKVVYRKLGKERVYGWCHDDCIEIDERLRGKKFLEILLHECLHWVNPEDSEEEIIRKSVLITNTLWAENIRPIENYDTDELQDGSV